MSKIETTSKLSLEPAGSKIPVGKIPDGEASAHKTPGSLERAISKWKSTHSSHKKPDKTVTNGKPQIAILDYVWRLKLEVKFLFLLFNLFNIGVIIYKVYNT